MPSPVFAIAKVTSKGQVTLPVEVRRFLNIHTGDRIRFESGTDEVRVSVERAESPFEAFRGIGNPGIPSGRKGLLAYTQRLRGR